MATLAIVCPAALISSSIVATASGALDGDEYIHHVDVQKLSDIPQITPTPTATSPFPTTTPTIFPTATRTPTPISTPGGGTAPFPGHVFEDINGNYYRDPFEPPIPGTLVEVYTFDNTTACGQAVTDNDGFYRVANLNPATYRVRPLAPAGWDLLMLERFVTVVAGHEHRGSILPGQALDHHARAHADATQLPRDANPYTYPHRHLTTDPRPTPTATPDGGMISGVVWHDRNRNQAIDPGEEGIEGITLELMNTAAQLVGQQVSASDGSYVFAGLEPETFHLVLLPEAGWDTTTATSHWLAPGIGAMRIDFGLAAWATQTPTATPQPGGHIHAYVWNDLNKNGLRDGGEPPLAGATILVSPSGSPQNTTELVTGSDGYARFD